MFLIDNDKAADRVHIVSKLSEPPRQARMLLTQIVFVLSKCAISFYRGHHRAMAMVPRARENMAIPG